MGGIRWKGQCFRITVFYLILGFINDPGCCQEPDDSASGNPLTSESVVLLLTLTRLMEG